MSDGNPGKNDHNFGISAGTFVGIAENKYVVAATMAAIVLAGSALLYGKRMRVAHSDFPHAVPEPEHAATRLIDQGGPDTRTPQDHSRLRVRHDDELLGGNHVGPSSSATSPSTLANRAQESDSSKEKSSRSKDRRRRGKDPLREVLKSGKKLKSFNVAPVPSSSALDLGTPAVSSPRSTGVQTDDDFQQPSFLTVTLASESATPISPMSFSDHQPTSSRSAGKRSQHSGREGTSSSSASNSTSSPSTSTSTSTPTLTTSSTKLLKRASSPNSNYDPTHGDAARSSRRGSITLSEDDATGSSGMISAGHSRVTSEVSQAGQTESLGSSASSTYLEDGEGPEREDSVDEAHSETPPSAVSEVHIGEMDTKAQLKEHPYLNESDARVRPRHLHYPIPLEEGDIVSSDDEDDEGPHNGLTGDRVRRLSGSASASLSVSNSRSHSHSPSPLRQSHTPSGSRDQSSSRTHPRSTGLRATSSSIASEKMGNGQEEERSHARDEDSRTGNMIVSRVETRRQDVGHEISEDADESDEYADRGRRTSRRGVVVDMREVGVEGEDLEAISRNLFGSVQSEAIEERTRPLEEDQWLEGMDPPLGITVVGPRGRSTQDFQSGVVDGQVEGPPESFSHPTIVTSASTPIPVSDNAREVHSDSSNVAMGSAHPEQSSKAKKRAKKAAAPGHTTTITQASSTTPRKVPPGASGWDWHATGASTPSTPAVDKGKTPRDRPDSRSFNRPERLAAGSQQKLDAVDVDNNFIDKDYNEGDYSTPTLGLPTGTNRKASYVSEPARSKKGGHRSTTPGVHSRGKSGTTPPLSPHYHRPNSPGDVLLAVSEHTQLASLRGALEAARQREEKHKAEMERVVKEMETLKWESAGLRRGEGELHAHVHHLTRQVQGYESFFASMGPSGQMYTQQPHVPPAAQNFQPEPPDQQSHLVDDKPASLEGQDVLASTSAHHKGPEVSLNSVDGEDSQSVSVSAQGEAGQLDSQHTQHPSTNSEDSGVTNSPEDQQADQPSSMKPLRLPIPPPLSFSTNLSSPGGPSAFPGFPPPMSPSFHPYPIPPTPFTPHGHPPHPVMVQQVQWMQASWASAHSHQPHQFGQGSPSQPPAHQIMLSPVMIPMPPYPPQSPHQPGTFQNPALPSTNGGGFNVAMSPSHFNFSLRSPRSTNGASAPPSAPETSSAGSVSPDLTGSPLALGGSAHRPMKNRMRSQRNNMELSDINEGRLAFGHGGSDGDDEDFGGTGGSAYSGLLADAILRRPGSIRALSSESLKKRAIDKGITPLNRSGSAESVEQLTEFTFPSISDMSSGFYRNSPRTESSISSSLSSSPPSSTATVPDSVTDSKPEGEKSYLPSLPEKVEIVDPVMSDVQPIQPTNETSSDATPRKEIAQLSTNAEL